jgi:thermitase
MSKRTQWIRRFAALSLAVAPWMPGDAHADWDQGIEPDQVVVSLVPGADIDSLNGLWGTTTLDAFPLGQLYLLDTQGADPGAVRDQLELDPSVVWVETNFIQDTPEGIRQMVISATGGTMVEYQDQSAAQRIRLDDAQGVTRGAGTTVAVLDTGIDTMHEVFGGSLSADGYDFIDDDDDPSETANGIDDDDDGQIDDCFGHGTMVAGIVALVAPEATILPLRVLDDEGRGDAWTIAKAIRYAQLQNVDVINMSFGIPMEIRVLRELVNASDSLGIVTVAGAGNENRDEPPYYPAFFNRTLMVAAVDSNDIKAPFSDFHGQVNVSAPGDGIRSAYPGGWGIGSGCSFAAPFVSGMAALVRSLVPFGPEATRNRIEQATDDIDHLPGNELWRGLLGTGRIDLYQAVTGFVTSVPVPQGIEGPGSLVRSLRVRPNPSSGPTEFRMSAVRGETFDGASLRAAVFDVTGRVLARLTAPAGSDVFAWNGLDANGSPAPAGVYFVRLLDDAGRTAVARFVIVP